MEQGQALHAIRALLDENEEHNGIAAKSVSPEVLLEVVGTVLTLRAPWAMRVP